VEGRFEQEAGTVREDPANDVWGAEEYGTLVEDLREVAIRQFERPPPARPGLIRPPVPEFEGPTTLPELGIVGGEELGPLEVGFARLSLLELVQVFGDLQMGRSPEGTEVARPYETGCFRSYPCLPPSQVLIAVISSGTSPRIAATPWATSLMIIPCSSM
jgi:hypothetical protein